MSVFIVSKQHCRLSKHKQTFSSGKETNNEEPEIKMETEHFPYETSQDKNIWVEYVVKRTTEFVLDNSITSFNHSRVVPNPYDLMSLMES